MMAAEPEGARRFYQQLPKVELHAHLNGSISSATMKKLMAQKQDLQVPNGMTTIDKGKRRSLEECFQMFQIIHQITNRTEDILMVMKDVVQEFAADGVKYLELRSTPRDEPTTGDKWISLSIYNCLLFANKHLHLKFSSKKKCSPLTRIWGEWNIQIPHNSHSLPRLGIAFHMHTFSETIYFLL